MNKMNPSANAPQMQPAAPASKWFKGGLVALALIAAAAVLTPVWIELNRPIRSNCALINTAGPAYTSFQAQRAK